MSRILCFGGYLFSGSWLIYTETAPRTKTAKALLFRHFPASVVVRDRGSNSNDIVLGMFSITATALNSFLVLLMIQRCIRADPQNPPSVLQVIKNADMAEDMQQDAIDCATQALEKYNIEKDVVTASVQGC